MSIVLRFKHPRLEGTIPKTHRGTGGVPIPVTQSRKSHNSQCIYSELDKIKLRLNATLVLHNITKKEKGPKRSNYFQIT